MIEYFPSEKHRNALCALRQKNGLTNYQDKRYYFAYDYGWRRVVMNDYCQQSPIDPNGEWFDSFLAGQAEAMWCREFKRAKPDPAKANESRHRTPEDLDFATERTAKVRAELKAITERSARAFGNRAPDASSAPGSGPGQAQHGGDADARLTAWQSTLGLYATPAAQPVPPDTTGLAMQCEPIKEAAE